MLRIQIVENAHVDSPIIFIQRSQSPSQLFMLTLIELISHGIVDHILQQTSAVIMSTRNAIISARLHCSWVTHTHTHKEKKKENTRTRGCPVGCNTSSLRFNVNLILSLVLRCFCLYNRQEGKQLCNQRLYSVKHT